MSGHSKWAQIKRKKAVIDAKRGNTFAKMAKEIIVAAKLGGPDPQANFRLRFAIEKAKANLVPANNIQRAIEKGSGQDSEGSHIEEITYEGYGAGGVAIMIQCATDNRNRTVGDIRSYFTKCKGKLGETNSVSWMFIKRGEIKVNKSNFKSQDEALEFILEIGADDVEYLENEFAMIITTVEDLEKVQEFVSKKKITILETQISYHPKEIIQINDLDTAKEIVKLIDLIENHDDVQNVFSNFEISQEMFDKIDT